MSTKKSVSLVQYQQTLNELKLGLDINPLTGLLNGLPKISQRERYQYKRSMALGPAYALACQMQHKARYDKAIDDQISLICEKISECIEHHRSTGDDEFDQYVLKIHAFQWRYYLNDDIVYLETHGKADFTYLKIIAHNKGGIYKAYFNYYANRKLSNIS